MNPGQYARRAAAAGIGVGFAAAWASGHIDLTDAEHAGWFGLASPLYLGPPRFDLPAASMTG